MTSRDYKQIQDLQLRYENYVQCRRFDLIELELLSTGNDLCYTHSDLDAPVTGRSAVLDMYRDAAEQFEKNNGFLRCDLSASQVLEIDKDGLHARGTWLTIGVLCKQEAFGLGKGQYELYRVMGQRHTEFVKEGDAWRMRTIQWKKLCELGPIQYDPEKCSGWSGVRERRWELPPTEKSRPWKGVRGR